MNRYVGENFAWTEPGGPNNDLFGGATGEPVHCIDCNLFRRRLPDHSIIEGCQEGQANAIDHLGEVIATIDGVVVEVEEDSPERIEVLTLKKGVLGEGGV